MSGQHLFIAAVELEEILDAGAQQCLEPVVVVCVGGVGWEGVEGCGREEEGSSVMERKQFNVRQVFFF